MTKKEQAEELVNKYMNLNKVKLSDYSVIYTPTAKQCALIAVDYLIKEQTMWQNGQVNPVLYWQEVKQEIEKL
jgi:hypothetical protein